MVEGRPPVTYNRSSSASGGGAGLSSGAGTWPDGTPKSTTSQGDRPDPRYPQLPPGVPVPGKTFYSRPGLIAPAFRGADGYTRLGPGSPNWTAGADDVLNKKSLTLRDVNRTPRRPR
jgi:hypothetical protein